MEMKLVFNLIAKSNLKTIIWDELLWLNIIKFQKKVKQTNFHLSISNQIIEFLEIWKSENILFSC